MSRIQDQFQVRKVADEEIPASSEAVLDAIYGLSRQVSNCTNRSVFGIEESEDFQVLRLSRASESRGAVFQGSKRVDTPFDPLGRRKAVPTASRQDKGARRAV